MKPIARVIRQKAFETIRPVHLNRGGPKIGKIVRFEGRIYYFSYRGYDPKAGKDHFMRIRGGFGISKGILKRVIDEENMVREQLGDKTFKLMIIIFYDGVNEKRYFLSDPYDWLMHGEEAEYTKDTGKAVETYGNQVFLSLRHMKLFGLHPGDHTLDRQKVLKYARRGG